MKIEHRGQNRLAVFKELYQEAMAAASEVYEKLDRHLAQYKGDRTIDGSDVKATQIRNITYELVESQVTGYLPNPSVSPKMQSEKNERCAKSIETLLRNKRDELPFEKLNDMDERYSPIYGGSVWLIEWDDSIVTHSTVGDVKISCLSPKRFVGQPHVYDIADMEYCFITFETTKEDIARKYHVTPRIAEETESEENADDKTATLHVCYYKNDADKICEYIWSGDTELLDIDDYFARKRKICKSCGKPEALCTCEKPKYVLQNEEYEELFHDISLSDGSVIPALSPVMRDGMVVSETVQMPMTDENGAPIFEDIGGVLAPLMADTEVPKTESTKLPFYTPKSFPIVIRKNTSEEDSLFGQSDCEFIRPQQQAINKLESRILEKLMNSGVFPIVPHDWKGELDNSIFKRVFRATEGDKHLFDRVDLQVDISRDTAQSDRLYDQAKRILGISDSFQGQYDSSAQSGKAKQIQVQQSQGRLDSKRQMKNAAYADMDRVIFEYYLAYADEPRPATYRDADGRLQNRIFNRYDFLERDEAGEWYYNDGYLFRTDATMDIEKSRETLWQENRQNFQSGAYGPAEMAETQLIFWQIQEKLHYPWAEDIVERLRAVIAEQKQAQMQAEEIAALQKEVENRAGYEGYLMEQIKDLTGGAGAPAEMGG